MIIDFHVHAFAAGVAPRALAKLIEVGGIPPHTDGTIAGTAAALAAWGIDRGVLLPIATKPSQQRTINDWAHAVNGGCIISFGTVFPLSAEGEESAQGGAALEELLHIKALGLKGIKLHPDYQGFFLEDERLLPLFERCAALGLIVVLHMGRDPISPDTVHAAPKAAAALLARFPKLTLVLAHLGGFARWDEVERYLVGTSAYLDTAFLADAIEPEQLIRIIKNHGADKILFASDCPWHAPTQEINLVRSLGLTEQEERRIFFENAASLLGCNA